MGIFKRRGGGEAGEFIGDPGEAGGEGLVLFCFREFAVHLLPEQQAGAGSGQILLRGTAGKEILAGRQKQAAAGVISRPQGYGIEETEKGKLFRSSENVTQKISVVLHHSLLPLVYAAAFRVSMRQRASQM